MHFDTTGCEAERGWGGGWVGLSLQIARWASGYVGSWVGGGINWIKLFS